MALAEHTKKAWASTFVNLLVLLFFVVVMVVGLNIYTDYAVNVDEALQRKHALINYTYINENVLGRNMDKLRATDEWLNEDGTGEGLKNYRSRSYGVALQLPMVAIEDAKDFKMTSQEIFQMRHIYNFLIYFCGLVGLFFLLNDLIKSKLIALAGTALFYLFPHFFASSYYNVKDMLFIPMFILACLFMVRVLTRKRKIGNCVLLVIFTAFASNIRIYGILPLAAAVVCMIVEDIMRRFASDGEAKSALELEPQSLWRMILPYIIIIFGFVGFWLLLAPAAWINPIDYAQQVVSKAAAFDMWTNNSMIFMGQEHSLETVPWYYLPVWMGITIPIFDIIMFLVGCGFLIATLFKSGRGASFVKNRVLWIFFLMFFMLFCAQILLGITIYLGWRHMYVLFVPLVVVMCFGIKALHEKIEENGGAGRVIVPIVTIAAVAIGAGRIAANHPYEHSMFNIIGIPIADQFDRDYYRMSSKQAIEWLFENYPDQDIEISSDVQLITPAKSFSPEDQKRIILKSQEQDKTKFQPAEFYIELYRYTAGNESHMAQEGYSEIHSIDVDGTKILSILQNDLIKQFEETGIFNIPLSYFKTLNGTMAADGQSITSNGQPNYLLYGPYNYFSKGKYVLQIKMKLVDGKGKTDLGYVDITADHAAATLTSKPIDEEEFDGAGDITLLLPFTLGASVNEMEFRVFTNEGVILTVESVTVYKE